MLLASSVLNCELGKKKKIVRFLPALTQPGVRQTRWLWSASSLSLSLSVLEMAFGEVDDDVDDDDDDVEDEEEDCDDPFLLAPPPIRPPRRPPAAVDWIELLFDCSLSLTREAAFGANDSVRASATTPSNTHRQRHHQKGRKWWEKTKVWKERQISAE